MSNVSKSTLIYGLAYLWPLLWLMEDDAFSVQSSAHRKVPQDYLHIHHS